MKTKKILPFSSPEEIAFINWHKEEYGDNFENDAQIYNDAIKCIDKKHELYRAFCAGLNVKSKEELAASDMLKALIEIRDTQEEVHMSTSLYQNILKAINKASK